MATHKTILVTGGAGFVGSHLCKRLLQEGHNVISLDNYFAGSHENHIAGVQYREGHTKDVAHVVPEALDLIYHLGEYSRVEISLREPDIVWDLNICGTFGILEYWRKHNVKLVYAGSSTKFADGGLGRDQSPYAWTKAANTELIRNYGSWFKLPYAITYFYNVYGPGERSGQYGTVIEIFRQKFLKNEPLTVVSPGTQKRNFTHVEDIIEGLILIAEKGEGDDYGLGDQREYSIIEIARMFGSEIEMLPERTGNRMSSPVETTKAKLLGWQVKHGIEDYVKSVIA